MASLPKLDSPMLELNDLALEPTPAPAAADIAPTAPLELSELALEPADDTSPVVAQAAPALAPSPAAPVLKIQTATRRVGAAGNKPLTSWRLSTLRSSADPAERCAADLLDKGANSTLWLLAQPLVPGQQLPTFLASAGLSPPGRVALWTGMNWNPKTAPDLWNAFVRAGYLELGPPSGETLPRSSRTAVRKALGASPDEYLLLFRAGPANSARGILAVFAFKSLVGEAAEAMERLNAASAQAA